MSLELAMIVLNITVLHGCNYAPVGDSCAPQSDLPHWYTGQPRGYSETMLVNLSKQKTNGFASSDLWRSQWTSGSWYLSGEGNLTVRAISDEEFDQIHFAAAEHQRKFAETWVGLVDSLNASVLSVESGEYISGINITKNGPFIKTNAMYDPRIYWRTESWLTVELAKKANVSWIASPYIDVYLDANCSLLNDTYDDFTIVRCNAPGSLNSSAVVG